MGVCDVVGSAAFQQLLVPLEDTLLSPRDMSRGCSTSSVKGWKRC